MSVAEEPLNLSDMEVDLNLSSDSDVEKHESKRFKDKEGKKKPVLKRLKKHSQIVNISSSSSSSLDDSFDEDDINVEDVEAVIEADDLISQDSDDSDDEEDDDDDGFIVDDDDISALARVINNKESHSALSIIDRQPKSKKRKREENMQTWREDIEQRRIMRVEHMREMSNSNPALKKRLEMSAVKRKELYGSKLKHHPLGLIGNLFFHQLVAVALLLIREALPFKRIRGGILADEMGVGKTTEMLALIAFDTLNGYTSQYSKTEIHYYPPTLVICPNSLISNWSREARDRFEPTTFQIVILNENYTRDWETAVNHRRLVEADLVIINYESLRSVHNSLVQELAADIVMRPDHYQDLYTRKPTLMELDPSKLRTVAADLAEKNLHYGFKTLWRNSDAWTARHFLYGYHFRRKVLDESTQFKNFHTKTFRSVLDIKAERVWALSGTPLENNMDELYSLMRVLGIDQVARSVGDIKRWHHFLKLDRGVKAAAHIPSAAVVNRIKKRFLNVLQLRREKQNMNGVDPLLDYIKRRQEETRQGWDAFVDARTMAKSERVLHRRGDAFIDTPVDDFDGRQAVYNRPLDELTQERLDAVDQTPIWALVTKDLHILPGFYWYTRQHDYNKAFDFVNSLLREAFDTDFAQLSQAVQSARQVMIERGIASPIEPEDREAIKEAIRLVMNNETRDPVLRGPIVVSEDIKAPKPMLFVGQMHPLEQAMYTSIVQSAAQRNGDEPRPMDVTSAFNMIMKARTCCADYRSVTGAPQKLNELRETVWPNIPADHCEEFQMDEVDIELLQSDVRDQWEAELDPATLKELDNSIPKAQRYLIPTLAATKAYMALRYLKAIPKDDKMVLFSDLVSFFPRLKRFFEKHGIKTVMITGDIKPGVDRDSVFADFKRVGDDTPKLLLASLKCVSHGHNLQVGNHVGIYSIWWNPAVEEQAKNRIMRLGQTKMIHIIYFALSQTIDELVLTKAGMKESIVTAVIGQDDGVVSTSANYTRPDLEDSHLMTFEMDAQGEIIIPDSGQWESSIQELLLLPPDPTFGETFANIEDSELLSKTGHINRVNVAAAITNRVAFIDLTNNTAKPNNKLSPPEPPIVILDTTDRRGQKSTLKFHSYNGVKKEKKKEKKEDTNNIIIL